MSERSEQSVQQIEIGELASQCYEQTHRYFQSQSYDESFCYELIRRAVVKRDAIAWEYTLSQYRPQIEAWVRRLSSHNLDSADAEDIVADAVLRCWRNYSADLFNRSTCLAEVLRYWQDCTRSTVFDWHRRQRRHRWTEAMDDELMAQLPVLPHQEGHVETQVDGRELSLQIWTLVSRHCQDSADHVVARRIFVEGQKPRNVYTETAGLFKDQTEVYRRLRRLKDGLRRDSNFHELWQLR